MKSTFIRFALAALCAGLIAPLTQAAPNEHLRQVLADPARAGERGQDARRHPAELVGLAELRSGQRVVDLIPGTGYWTRIFSKMVGPRGRVYAIWPNAYAKVASGNVADLRKSAGKNVEVLVEPGALLTAPQPVDVVWTSDNYHDYNDKFMGNPGPQSLAKAAYRALKPGGLFIVIDHAAGRGRGMRDTETMHRIERASVIEQATAVGFRLVGESSALANPRDPLNIPVFDRRIRFRTQQFALKFRKPGR
jgi:predicted methyltransferase